MLSVEVGSDEVATSKISRSGTACVRVRHTDTYEVVKEVTGVGTEEAMELYEKLFNLYAKFENFKMPCCIR